jgi:hypothetical protein
VCLRGCYWRRRNSSVTFVVGTKRAAYPAERIEVMLCITVNRADLFLREANRIAEMCTCEDLRSTVFQLTLDLLWHVAAFHQGLIDDQIRIVGGGIRARGSRRSRRGRRVCRSHYIVWCWRWGLGRATGQHQQGQLDRQRCFQRFPLETSVHTQTIAQPSAFQ